jgi:hypothetical protein
MKTGAPLLLICAVKWQASAVAIEVDPAGATSARSGSDGRLADDLLLSSAAHCEHHGVAADSSEACAQAVSAQILTWLPGSAPAPVSDSASEIAQTAGAATAAATSDAADDVDVDVSARVHFHTQIDDTPQPVAFGVADVPRAVGEAFCRRHNVWTNLAGCSLAVAKQVRAAQLSVLHGSALPPLQNTAPPQPPLPSSAGCAAAAAADDDVDNHNHNHDNHNNQHCHRNSGCTVEQGAVVGFGAAFLLRGVAGPLDCCAACLSHAPRCRAWTFEYATQVCLPL